MCFQLPPTAFQSHLLPTSNLRWSLFFRFWRVVWWLLIFRQTMCRRRHCAACSSAVGLIYAIFLLCTSSHHSKGDVRNKTSSWNYSTGLVLSDVHQTLFALIPATTTLFLLPCPAVLPLPRLNLELLQQHNALVVITLFQSQFSKSACNLASLQVQRSLPKEQKRNF